MHSQITYASVRECGSRRLLEIKPGNPLSFIQGHESEGFLLALAGLFGSLPENCFHSMEEYAVKADVLWEDGASCKLCGCFSKEEKAVWVHSVEGALPSLSAQTSGQAKAIHKRRFRNGSNTAHIFDNISQSGSLEMLGESDAILQRFHFFLQEVHRCSLLGDTRPLFLSNFLERLDEAVDLRSVFIALAATGRQVFIAVPHSYQIKTLEDMPYDTAIHTL